MAKMKAASGFRDFLPDACRKRADLMRRIKATYEAFGYEPIETPALENLAVFLGKGGGENEKLMYKLLKRGEKLQRALETGVKEENDLADAGLRFDLTVPLARFFAEHRAELPTPFKRYHIGPVWRAERAQHGRFREFIQCDVDAIGSGSMMVESDVLLATATALSELGFSGLEVKLNSRALLHLLVGAAGVAEAQRGETITALDKLEKIGADGVRGELAQRGVPGEAAARLLEFYAASRASAGLNLLDETGRNIAAWSGASAEAELAGLREVLELTPDLPSGKLVFDPFLARGLDYYTGPVFEVAAEGVPFSLAGGGRYDEMVGNFTGQPTPACGFSIGFERICTVMDERGMFGAGARAADVLVAALDDARPVERAAIELGQALRKAGLRADVFPGQAKPARLYELAEKKGIPILAQLGGRELQDGAVQVRDLKTRQSAQVPRDAVAAHVRKILDPAG
ncbi:MAG: histidine--tRNA ligase [Planctomycetota bacterium]|nr:histidine--tRNA ligase [Planctomycetota bacterium]